MKIRRILIANRGEIAVRIMRTARNMKIETGYRILFFGIGKTIHIQKKTHKCKKW